MQALTTIELNFGHSLSLDSLTLAKENNVMSKLCISTQGPNVLPAISIQSRRISKDCALAAFV